MKKIIMRMLLVGVLCISLQFFAKAQGGPNGDDVATDPDLPLDPGSWVLVAAGVGYGLKKWRDAKYENQKNKQNATNTDLSSEDGTGKN